MATLKPSKMPMRKAMAMGKMPAAMAGGAACPPAMMSKGGKVKAKGKTGMKSASKKK